ncbi:MAG: PhzF family phenazine biosynthesis isomerase [Proteobacteria bacterium]|nr:PhzF family phenazine biosynthesis isomerase [Pseudomonadota bacterium]
MSSHCCGAEFVGNCVYKAFKGQPLHIRWFTPKVEVNLCGHATLASAHILYEERIVKKDETIIFDSLSGKLAVTQENNYLQLDFPLQETGPLLNKHDFETSLRLKSEIINVVKASDEIIVELETEEMVRRFLPNFDLLSLIEAQAIILTARGKKFDFVSRCFAPREGINEDPVTGSAHCKLAHYWGEKLGKKEMIAYQASERGGEIQIKIAKDRVLLKGKAVTTMAGDWKA